MFFSHSLLTLVRQLIAPTYVHMVVRGSAMVLFRLHTVSAVISTMTAVLSGAA
jgi:hypothetical protein